MCLAVPGRVIEVVESRPPFGAGIVEFAGIKRHVSLACVPEAHEGDYVLVHAGVAIARIDESEAARVLETLAQIDLDDDFNALSDHTPS